MIPKIIHMCWLSGNPFPADIQKCFDSWKIHLSDYEIWLWGKAPSDSKSTEGLKLKEIPFDLNSILWTKQAFETKKYAFAADYIRLYALYNYGGIYLDSDIVMYKSFYDLLDLPYFIGQAYERQFEPAAFGCEKGQKWIKDVLDHYTGRPFVKLDGSLDTLALPRVFHGILKDKYIFYRIRKKQPYTWDGKTLYVFDQDFFNSRDCLEVRRTKKSYCAHNYAGSWVKESKSGSKKIQSLLPKWMVKLILHTLHSTIYKKKTRRFEPPFLN